jgi:predicted aspartyl protease
MAGYREVGIGIASALASEHSPNPLVITLMGQSLSEAGRIVLAALDECAAASIELAKVELDGELYGEVRAALTSGQHIVCNADLHCEVRFFRGR